MLSTKNMVVLGIAGVVVAYSYSKGAEHRQKLIDEYQLTSQQVEIMDACKSTFRRYKKKFKQNVSKTRGCACIAHHVAQNSAPEHYESASKMFDVLMKSSKVDASQRAQLLYKSDREMTAQMPVVLDAFSYCASEENHLSDKQRAALDEAKERRRNRVSSR